MIEFTDLTRKIQWARKYILNKEYDAAYDVLYLPPELTTPKSESSIGAKNNKRNTTKYLDVIKINNSENLSNKVWLKIKEPDVYLFIGDWNIDFNGELLFNVLDDTQLSA